MDRRVHLVHGILSSEGESNVFNMKAPIESITGLGVDVFEYGFQGPISAQLNNRKDAQRLADIIQPDDILVGHSNGADVIWFAVEKYGAKPSGVILIQPALEPQLMPTAKWAHVYYNHDDKITWWSQLMPFSPWGKMGEVGYIPKGYTKAPSTYTNDKGTRITQVDTIVDAPSLGLPIARGHLEIFQSPRVGSWGVFVGQRILNSIANERAAT